MRVLLSKLTYANVIATIALFLALGGGAVMAAEQLGKNAVTSANIAANAVKTQDIAKNAVKSSKIAAKAVKNKNLAANAVSGPKVKKEALTRSKLKAGTLAGLQVADAQATSVPGLTVEPPTAQGTAVPLTGTGIFTPVAGKSYELLAELRGTPTDANGPGGESCFAGVQVFVNGEPIVFVSIGANASAEPPFAVNAIGNASTAVGLLSTAPQTITASSYGEPACGHVSLQRPSFAAGRIELPGEWLGGYGVSRSIQADPRARVRCVASRSRRGRGVAGWRSS